MDSTAMETQGPHISDLPVDVMLEVFSRLPAADLVLNASAVCRAWNELALEPGAWQGRYVQVAPRRHRPLTAAERRVLRRAPALRALAVSLWRAQDLPAPLSALLPRCRRLRELKLSLPSLQADMAADVAAHWPRLRSLHVDACLLQEGCLDRLAQLRHLRALQLASLQPAPARAVWAPLRRACRAGLPSLRALDVDARCDAAVAADLEEAAGLVLDLADRLTHLRLGSLVPADTQLLTAVGQCTRLQSLHIEDSSSLTDEGLLRLAGLRLESLTLYHAKNVSTSALLSFLRLADLSLLRQIHLSHCLSLNDRVIRLLVSRCSQCPSVIAQDCPNVSSQALQCLPRTPLLPSTTTSQAPCTVASMSASDTSASPRPLGVA